MKIMLSIVGAYSCAFASAYCAYYIVTNPSDFNAYALFSFFLTTFLLSYGAYLDDIK